MKRKLLVHGIEALSTMTRIVTERTHGPEAGRLTTLVADLKHYERLLRWPRSILWLNKWKVGQSVKPYFCAFSSVKVNGKTVNIPLASLLLNVPLGVLVDHIDRNPANHFDVNLRRATRRLNALNRSDVTINVQAIQDELAYIATLPWEPPFTWDYWEEQLGVPKTIYVLPARRSA